MSETNIQTVSPELIKQVRDTNDLCHAAHTYYEKSQAILSEIKDISASRRRRMPLGFITLGIATFFSLPAAMIGESVEAIPLYLFLFGLIGFAIFWFVYVCGISLNRKETVIRERARKEQEKGEAVLQNNVDVLKVIPNKYWFPIATNYLLEMLATGRVSTLNEGLDKVDEYLHRMRMEEQQSAILTAQIMQLATLQRIERNTLWDVIL